MPKYTSSRSSSPAAQAANHVASALPTDSVTMAEVREARQAAAVARSNSSSPDHTADNRAGIVLNRPASGNRNIKAIQQAFQSNAMGATPLGSTVRASKQTNSTSRKIQTVINELERFCSVISSIQMDCQEQARNPELSKTIDYGEREMVTVHCIGEMEIGAINAIRMVNKNSVSDAQFASLTQRREKLSHVEWPLTQCKHSTTKMLEAISQSALMKTLSDINNWCALRLARTIAQQTTVITKLRKVAEESAFAERKTTQPKALKKILNHQIAALDNAGIFLFESLITAGEIAIQRSHLLCHLAEVRPALEQRWEKTAVENYFQSKTKKLLRRYEQLFAEAALPIAKPVGSGPEFSTEPEEESTTRSSSPNPDIPDATATAPSPRDKKPAINADTPRRSKTERAIASTSARHPKYDHLAKARGIRLRQKNIQKILQEIDDTQVDKKILVVEFYKAYSDLKASDSAGWKHHLALLDDARYEIQELSSMRRQLRNDLLKLLNDADNDPETDRIYVPPGTSDDQAVHEQAVLFISELRACHKSESNSAYFAYAARQLTNIVQQSGMLSLADDTYESLLLAREILPLAADHAADEDATIFAHMQSRQPSIRLTQDALYVEIVDSTRSSSNLYLEGNGFRTSVARAAELLATAATGSTRYSPFDAATGDVGTKPAEKTPASGRPTTPSSAVWVQSLSQLAPYMVEKRGVVIPYVDGCLKAKMRES